MKRVDVAYTLLLDKSNQKLLLVKNLRDNNTFDYTLPGGAVEEGETLIEAAKREAMEETGLVVEINDLASVGEACFEKSGHHAVFFTFFGEIIDGEVSVSRPNEILDVEWVELDTADELLRVAYPYGISTLLTRQGAPYFNRGYVRIN